MRKKKSTSASGSHYIAVKEIKINPIKKLVCDLLGIEIKPKIKYIKKDPKGIDVFEHLKK